MNERTEEKKEQDTLCNIMWHYNSAYRRYDTTSLRSAHKKWNEINNQASRIFLINNLCDAVNFEDNGSKIELTFNID